MRRAVGFLALLLSASTAQAVQTGTIPPPQLVPGTYVYTSPPGFVPPGIGVNGLGDMQEAAARLHQPFYVVVVQSLPGMSGSDQDRLHGQGYTQSGEELQTAYATDKLMEDWAQTYPNYDVQKSSLFVLSYSPHKFFFVGGAEWKSRLGLQKDSLKQFTDIFRKAVSGSPKDPKGGIIRMMQSFDSYVFQRTDPTILAAQAAEAARQAEIARKAEIEQRAQAAREAEQLRESTARAALDEQNHRLMGLLSSDNRKYSPTDVGSYMSLLQKGQEIRSKDDPKDMLAFAASMKPDVDVLDKIIGEAKAAALWAGIVTVIKLLIALAMIGFAVMRLVARKSTFEKRVQRFNDRKAKLDGMITSAATKYVDSYAKRDGIVAMKDVTGETKKLWDRATAEVDDIWIGVQALKEHFENCAKLAATATFWNTGLPADEAYDKLSATFDFDTGKVNKAELFAPTTTTIKVPPEQFMGTLAQRFQKNQSDWETLTAAADARLVSAKDAFPHTGMNELLKITDEKKIPQKWLQDHPLAGDDASDEHLWSEADKLRWTDPVGFLAAIQGFKYIEKRIKVRVQELVQARGVVNEAKIESLPTLDTVLTPGDDPAVTLASARSQEHEFERLLNVPSADMNTQAVGTCATVILNLYIKAKNQQGSAEIAIKNAESRLVEANKAVESAGSLQKEAEGRVATARTVHAKAGDAVNSLTAAKSVLSRARSDQKKAESILNEKKHLDAWGRADQVVGSAKEATRLFKEAISACDALDRQKVQFEERQRKAESRRTEAIKSVQRYGGRKAVPAYQPIVINNNGPVDYGLQVASIVMQEHAWESMARAEQERFEAEQARQRAEEQRRQAESQRQADAEAAASRRSSYDSYSSSSSSSSYSSDSYGGGGSSGDGGGGGGGGSSGDGGGW